MSDLITLNIPSIPMDAADEIANAFGLGGNMQSQVSTFARNNPKAVEEAAKLGMDLDQYYMNQILGIDIGQSGVNQYGDSNQNFVQNLISDIGSAGKNVIGDGVNAVKGIASAGKNVFTGNIEEAIDDLGEVLDLGAIRIFAGDTGTDKEKYKQVKDQFDTDAITSGALNFGKNIVGSASSMLGGAAKKAADVVADADDATVMDSSAAGGFLRDDITGEGTFLGGANTLMEDDETINYNTDTSGSNQGSSGMDSRFEEYYKILREQGPQAAEIYAQNLGLFVEGVGSALFGAARQYTDEQLMSLGRRVGIDDGSVPTIQEITQAGVVLDPSEERRVMDSLMGSQVGGGREFDPAVLQAGIDMNQMMYNRRQPFITAGINASDIAPGIAFGGGIAATMEGALPTFSDIFKMNQADVQNQFNQQLLASQESASDVNKILGTVNALSGAYDANLFGLQDLITNTFENFGRGGNRFEDTRQDRMDSFDDRDPTKLYG